MVARNLGSAARARVSVARAFCLLTLLVPAILAGPARADSAQYFYDPDGRLVAVIDPVKGSAQYTYDATGNILSVTNNPITAVEIVQFSPATGPAGTVVTIAGTGFDTTADTTVNFNGMAATASAVTATAITVTVPAGATTGPITVTAPGGSVTSTAAYTVAAPQPAPLIASFSPATVVPGNTLTITGSNFDPANSKVEINGRATAIISATATTIVVTVPLLSSGKVVVETPLGNATSTTDLIVAPPGYAVGAIASAQRSTLPALNASQAVTATIGSAGQIAMVLFDGNAGQTVSMVAQADSTLSQQYVGVTILAPDGSAAYSNFFYSWPTFTDAVALPQAGTYTIVLSPYATATGTATLALYNLQDATGTITAGGPAVTAAIAVPGDNAQFTFTGQAGQAVSLIAQADSSLAQQYVGLKITAPDGSAVYSNFFYSWPTFTDAVALPQTGTYTIQINPYSTATGTATLTLYNLQDATGTLTPGGGAVTAAIAAPGDNAQYTFSGQAGQAVSLVAQADSSLSQQYVGVTITAPDGTTQVYSKFFYAWPTFTDAVALPQTGTYTIFMNPYATATGTATLTLYNVQDATGTLTPGGGAVTAAIAAPGDNAQYTFSGQAGQAVSLVAQADSSLSQQYVGVTITAPDGTTQVYNGFFYSWPTFTDAVALPQTGTYTILVNPSSTATGTATLTLYGVQDATGTITPGGPAVAAVIAAPGDNAQLTFAGQAGQAVSLLVQDDSALAQQYLGGLMITAPDGTTRVYNNFFYSSPAFTDAVALPQTGTYTISLNPYSTATGTATLTLYSVQNATGTIAPGGLPVAAVIAAPGDNAQLTFSGQAGQAVSLLVQDDSALAQQYLGGLTITAPDGTTQVYNNFFYSSPAFTDAVALPQTGTYTILLNPYALATGTATLTLYGVQNATGAIAPGGASVTAAITSPGDNAQYAFSGQAGQAVSLLVQDDGSLAQQYLGGVTITAPDGTTQVFNNFFYSSPGFTNALALPQTGTYTIFLNPYATATGTATLTLFDAGTSVTGATDFTATIPSAGATAQLAFSGNSGSRVSLLTQADTTLRQGCFTIALTAPGAASALYSSTQASPTDFSHALVLPASGLYTMLLTPCGTATGTAALTLYAVPPDESGSTTIGGSAASLTTLVPGQNAQVTVATGTANQTANVSVTADASFSSACYTVTVTAPGGAVVNTGQGCGTSYSSGVLTLAASGTYTIAVASVSTAVGNVQVGVTAQ